MWILKIDLWRVAFNTQNNEDLSFVISCFRNLQYQNMIIYCLLFLRLLCISFFCILFLYFSIIFVASF